MFESKEITLGQAKPLWRQRIYDDYSIQVIADADDNVKWQILGICDDKKDILKELNNIPFQSRFETGQHREYCAEDKAPVKNPIIEKGLPFVAGLIVGGFGVYLYMQARIKQYEETIASMRQQMIPYQSYEPAPATAPVQQYSAFDFSKMNDYHPNDYVYPEQ